MEKTDPHKKHSYSQDYVVMTALVSELFHVRNDSKYENVREQVESYMTDRLKEIKERWK